MKLKEKQKKVLIQVLNFLAIFISVYLILMSLTLLIVPLTLIEGYHAIASNEILKMAGIEGKIVFTEPVQILIGEQTNQQTILISFLCSGLIELIVLISCISATFNADLKKKLKGIALALVAWLILNPIRIALTILIALNASVEIAEIVHGILFKLSLFIIIIGIYFVWMKYVK